MRRRRHDGEQICECTNLLKGEGEHGEAYRIDLSALFRFSVTSVLINARGKGDAE